MRLVYEHLTDIPSNFTEVEYLESFGNQWIKTGIFPANEMEFESKFTFTSLVSTNLTIIGSRDSTKRCQPIGAYNNKWSASIGDSYDANGSSVSANTSYVVKSTISNGQIITLTVNGNQASMCTSATGLPNQELYIFGRNFYGNIDPVDSRVNAKMYFMKIKAGNVLVRDFVPCLDNNNVPCLYDKVEGKAYYNQGTGSFTYGRKIIPVEYLESSGTQYIDTAYTFQNVKHKTVSKISNTTAGAQVPSWLFGSYSGEKRSGGLAIQTGETKIGIGCGNIKAGSTTFNINVIGNTPATLIVDALSSNKFSFTGGSTDYVEQSYTGDTLTNLSEYIFCAHGQSGPADKSCLKIYSHKIYDNDILVRDFIPCKDENNVGFMFDRVTHTAYLNVGTGSFITGSVKPKKKLRLIRESKRRLPKNFREVEYLEGTGTQYIDTGVKSSGSLKVELVTESKATSGSCNIFGLYSQNNDCFAIFQQSSSLTYAAQYRYVDNNAGRIVSNVSSPNNKITAVLDKGAFYINGNFIGSKTYYDFSSTRNLFLFAINREDGGGILGPNPAKIYLCKMYNNDILVRDFIPCLDASNVPCMYDLVEGKAYYNAGTGSFSYGHTITPVEYLESSGTQYIDTGYKFTSNMRFKINHIPTGSISDNYFTGHYATDNKVFLGGFYQNKCIWGIGKLQENTINASANQKFVVDMTYTSNSSTNTSSVSGTINGQSVSLTSTALQNFVYGLNILAFARNNNGSVGHYLSCKLYSFQIYNSDTLVRDYIPVKDENNVGYMFDKVTHSLYANAGTGAFVVGNEIKQDITRFVKDDVPNIYRKVSYLQSSGTQYIDTGVREDTTCIINMQATQTTNTTQVVLANTSEGSRTKWFGVAGTTNYYSVGGSTGVSSVSATTRKECVVTFTDMYSTTRGSVSFYFKDDPQTVYTRSDTVSSGITLTNICVGSSVPLYPSYVKLFGLKIYNTGNVLLRDFIPVVRKSDNKPGMYDRVSKQFFTNSGTGEFIIPT